MPADKHGVGGYQKWGCRCDACCVAVAAYKKAGGYNRRLRLSRKASAAMLTRFHEAFGEAA